MFPPLAGFQVTINGRFWVTAEGRVPTVVGIYDRHRSRVSLVGITRHPDQAWIQQMARNKTGEAWGFLGQRRYALHDRDTKFCSEFRAT